MSPRTALLLLVLGSAAASMTSSSSSGNMIRSVMKNNLNMALALSRLPAGAMSMVGRFGRLVGRYQSKSTTQVVGENKNVWNDKKRFKLCAKCPPPFGFFEKEQNKKGLKIFSFGKIIKQAFLEAWKERLSQAINQRVQRKSGNTVNSRTRLL